MIIISLRYQRIGAKYLSTAPIDLHEVIVILGELGYRPIRNLPPLGFRRGIGGSGPIARKDNVIVDVDTARHVLGVTSPDLKQLMSEFKAVEEALGTRLKGYTRPQFYEGMVEYEISVEGANFYSAFERVGNLSIVGVASRALGVKASLLGVRIGLKKAQPEDEEWLDIEIIPSLSKGSDVLYFSMLYRSSDKEKAFNIMGKARSLALNVTKHLLQAT